MGMGAPCEREKTKRTREKYLLGTEIRLKIKAMAVTREDRAEGKHGADVRYSSTCRKRER